MICILMFGLLSLHVLGGSADTRDIAWQRARSLAEANRFDDALNALEPYATAVDFETRLYVARLHAWKKEYGIAESLYRKVLLDDPGNLDATLGLADTLAWAKRFKDALSVLSSLSIAGSNAEITLHKARYEWWSGNRRAARADLKRLLQMSPGNQEAKTALAAVNRQKLFQLDLGVATDDASAIPRANTGTVAFTYNSPRDWTVTAGIQQEQRFKNAATHYLIGASTLVRDTSLFARYSWAAPNQFLARSDFQADVIHRLGKFAFGGGYRQVAFPRATVRIPALISDAQVTTALSVEARLTPTYTTAGSWRQGAMSGVNWKTNRWVATFARVAIGNAASGTIVNGEMNYLATQTYTAGATLQCSEFQSVTFSYFHENRGANVAANGLATEYRVRF